MTTLPTDSASLLHAPPARRTRAFKSLSARALERAGRAIVSAAMRRTEFGRVTLVDHTGTMPAETALTGNTPAAGPHATVHVRDPAFFAAAAFGGNLGIAEAFMDGLWDSDDLPTLVEIIASNHAAMRGLEGPLARALTPLSRSLAWLERNTRAGSRRNIHAHYDLGNDFFALFLDPTMTYSCGIFENNATSLHQAQIEKIDRACRALELRPDDHLLEIGTGWGALALHAASRYGCRVTTTTISAEQHRLAEERIRVAGLTDRITVLTLDYRDLPRRFPGTFDKLVSIEMVEAVGKEHFGDFALACSACLKPHGLAFIQSIVIRDQRFASAARRRDFLKKHIFPGSCLPSVTSLLDAFRDRSDLFLARLDDIGPHYTTTLRLWRQSFLERRDDARRLGFDDRFLRMWEFYLAYCEGAFRASYVGNAQMLLAKPRSRLRSTTPDLTAPGGTGRPPQTHASTPRTHTPASQGSPA
ncbi:MAG: class I SAM-dependent methyltransferase [Phycisphaerales bacterium]